MGYVHYVAFGLTKHCKCAAEPQKNCEFSDFGEIYVTSMCVSPYQPLPYPFCNPQLPEIEINRLRTLRCLWIDKTP